jgi:UDP-glucose 4-epimerase
VLKSEFNASPVCLVTGAAGFIGSHLVDSLLEFDATVVGVDNLVTGRLGNLSQAMNHASFSFVQGDISNSGFYDGLKSFEFDYCFHLAGLADIVPSIEKPLDYFRSNVQGTLNLLEYIRKQEKKCRKFLYSASSSCYGIPSTFPTNEQSSIDTRYPYALTKYLGEELVIHWSKVFAMNVASLRLFNVYGPRSRTSGAYGAVFGVFLSQKLANMPLTVVGNGNQTRDFTHVSDVVRAFLSVMQSNTESKIFNVGSGKTISINTIVKLLNHHSISIPKRPGEPDCTFADISRITKETGWMPTVSIEDGVSEMLEHIDDWRDSPVWTSDSIKDATKAWFNHLGN